MAGGALNVKSRTLRAEIDQPNPDGEIRPGMYAYGNVVIERPGVWAVPMDAIDHDSDQDYCWFYENGKARKIEVQTGIDDGEPMKIGKATKASNNPHGI